jgi:transposase
LCGTVEFFVCVSCGIDELTKKFSTQQEVMETRKRRTSEAGPSQFPAYSKEHLRAIISFSFRRGLSAKDCAKELQTVLGDEAPTLRWVQKWFARFKTGHFVLEDDPREGRPRTSTDDQNVARVKEAIDEDPRTSLEKLEELLGIDATSVGRILRDNLGYSKKSARWVPRLLKQEEKDARVNFCRQFLTDFKDGTSANFQNIVTGDKAWFHFLDPETKRSNPKFGRKKERRPRSRPNE